VKESSRNPGLSLRTLLGKCDQLGIGEPLRQKLHLTICVADKAADRAVGVADWVYGSLAAKATVSKAVSVWSQPLSSASGAGEL
jgi:hypothetical protein